MNTWDKLARIWANKVLSARIAVSACDELDRDSAEELASRKQAGEVLALAASALDTLWRTEPPEAPQKEQERAAFRAAEGRRRGAGGRSGGGVAEIIGSRGGGSGGVVADVRRGGDGGGDMDDVMSQVKGVGVARGGEGGVLRKVSGGSGDGAGGG